MGFYSNGGAKTRHLCLRDKPILKQREKIVPKLLVEYWKSAWVRDITCRITTGANSRYCGHRSLLHQLEARPAAGG